MMHLRKNIDTSGRLIRLAIALLLLGYAWWAHSWIALGFSLFTFYEALAGWCVVLWLLGKNACSK
jgi:hypothetical protein